MRILVVGGGGREHAIVWKLAQYHKNIFCAPGNAGISRLAECVDIDPHDKKGLVDFARREHVELTVVGPEGPLAAGLVDDFRHHGLVTFGPDAAGARLESDKAFAKELMAECGIPTAGFAVFDDVDRARQHARSQPFPLAIKAVGLAAGKGVIICRNAEEAEAALGDLMVAGKLGPAGSKVIVEEHLEGEEASIIGLCDGTTVKLLASSQDHKRLLDNDEGPNTGGMGAYAPAPVVTPEVLRQVEERVFRPLLDGLKRRGIDYRGVVYAGMMLTEAGPYVLEFNCRFGDPETQVLLPLLQGDLAELAMACNEGVLAGEKVVSSGRSALCVVLAVAGYPGAYQKGMPLAGDLTGAGDVMVFHAGTRMENGRVVASGGRVLGVTALGDTLAQARDRAYAAAGLVHFDGMFRRSDIGARGLKPVS